MKPIVLLIIISCGLMGCSMFSPVQRESQTTYVLNAPVSPVTPFAKQATTIQVFMPEASPRYNSTNMAYTSAPYQLAYFSKNRWTETPAEMMQPLMVQSLQNTHFFKTVGNGSALGHYDYILTTQLLEFQQYFNKSGSFFRITLRAQILRTMNNQVIATKTFSVTKEAPTPTPYGGVVAANQATAEILYQLTEFTIAKIR